MIEKKVIRGFDDEVERGCNFRIELGIKLVGFDFID